MRWWMVVFSALLVVPPAQAQKREPGLHTPAYYLAKCERPEGEWASLCVGYVKGLIDMYDGLNLFLRETNPTIGICLPDGLKLGAIQDSLLQQIKRGSTDARLDTNMVLIDALKEDYPCPYIYGKPNPRLKFKKIDPQR